MNKYYFVNMGAQVKWHPYNNDECRIMQICTLVHHPVKDKTEVDLVAVGEVGDIDEEANVSSYKAKAEELSPVLDDFDRGYWCAIRDAVGNSVSDLAIRMILRSAGFTFWEAYWHMKDSDVLSSQLRVIIREMFCQTPQYIDWCGAEYPTKSIVIHEGTPEEEVVTVSTERLGNQLLDDMGNWSTREAQAIDEQIYYYLDEETFNYPDEDIAEILENQGK